MIQYDNGCIEYERDDFISEAEADLYEKNKSIPGSCFVIKDNITIKNLPYPSSKTI